MSEMIARFKPGQNLPGFCTAAVRAGRFVKIAAGKTQDGDYSIAECTAGAKVLGVAERNGLNAAEEPQRTSWRRRVNVVRSGAVARVVAGEAITAGWEVESDAQGRAVKAAAGIKAGQALMTVAAAGEIVEISLY